MNELEAEKFTAMFIYLSIITTFVLLYIIGTCGGYINDKEADIKTVQHWICWSVLIMIIVGLLSWLLSPYVIENHYPTMQLIDNYLTRYALWMKEPIIKVDLDLFKK